MIKLGDEVYVLQYFYVVKSKISRIVNDYNISNTSNKDTSKVYYVWGVINNGYKEKELYKTEKEALSVLEKRINKEIKHRKKKIKKHKEDIKKLKHLRKEGV